MRRHRREPGSQDPQPGELACREKTSRRNVYGNKKRAKQAASQMRRRCGDKIDWFRCPHCGLYHLGRNTTDKERLNNYLDQQAIRQDRHHDLSRRDPQLEYEAMANLNKVQLIGRLGRDPEIKTFTNGGKVANISICVNNRTKNQQSGQWEDAPVWLYCKAFNREQGRKMADIFEQYTHKGDQVYIEGRLTMEEWTDKDTGAKRTALKIIVDDLQLLQPKQGGGHGEESQEGRSDHEYSQARPAARSNGHENGQQRQPAAQPASSGPGEPGGDEDSEIPF